jgi:hypothetical protein
MSGVKCIAVSLSRIHAVVNINLHSKEVRILYCTNCNFCNDMNILSSDGTCPAYCEVIVAAKNRAFARRKPKAKAYELPPDNCERLKLEQNDAIIPFT